MRISLNRNYIHESLRPCDYENAVRIVRLAVKDWMGRAFQNSDLGPSSNLADSCCGIEGKSKQPPRQSYTNPRLPCHPHEATVIICNLNNFEHALCSFKPGTRSQECRADNKPLASFRPMALPEAPFSNHKCCTRLIY